jgi:hypothetical protein
VSACWDDFQSLTQDDRLFLMASLSELFQHYVVHGLYIQCKKRGIIKQTLTVFACIYLHDNMPKHNMSLVAQ